MVDGGSFFDADYPRKWVIFARRFTDNSSDNIVIVSRDSDFGVLWEKKAYLNDWLLQEFRARVSKKRKISLTTRLTEGFKEANIRVTDKEVQEEEEFVERVERSRRARYSLGPREDGEENDEFEEVIGALTVSPPIWTAGGAEPGGQREEPG